MDYILKEFCEEYIRLAQDIVLWDKDEMDLIDKSEERVSIDLLMGKSVSFKNQDDIKLHFMRIRVNKIADVINDNVGAQKRQKELTKFLAKHGIECASLKLSHNNGALLTPAQIYANYYFISERLRIINANIKSKEK